MSEFATQLEPPVTTSLKQLLVDRILSEGPITFHDWMNAALYSPSSVTTCEPISRDGAGKVTIGPARNAANCLLQPLPGTSNSSMKDSTGQGDSHILEAGAGDGTFAHGVLCHLREHSPDVYGVTQYLIDELSEDARGANS